MRMYYGLIATATFLAGMYHHGTMQEFMFYTLSIWSAMVVAKIEICEHIDRTLTNRNYLER